MDLPCRGFSDILGFRDSEDPNGMGVLKQIDSKGALILPKEMRVAGVTLYEVEQRPDGVIELRPKVAVDASQSWFWTERWQQMEREADEDIRAGRVRQFDDVDGLLADLAGEADS
jgi:hypothetical protein